MGLYLGGIICGRLRYTSFNVQFQGTVILSMSFELLLLLFSISDYLYRVESYHAGTMGSAKSAWIASRSGQGGKISELLGLPATAQPRCNIQLVRPGSNVALSSCRTQLIN